MINVYCDESCHLEHDSSKVMVIGALSCPISKVRFINEQIKELKYKHGISNYNEIKWVKVSESKIDFYKELVDIFFGYKYLTYRALVVSDKTKLKHNEFNQDHNLFYDKMYYLTLSTIIDTEEAYNIYVDIKDTHTYKKVKVLENYLRNKFHDRDGTIIKKIQPVDSIETNIIQLADILIGLTGYINRNLNSSKAKVELIQHVKSKTLISFNATSSYNSKKINIFMWDPI